VAGLYPGGLWSPMVGVITGVLAVGFLLRGLIAVTGVLQSKATVLLICCAVAMATAGSNLELRPTLWYTPTEDPAEALATWRNGERLLFDQPAKVDAELARLDAPADDAAAAYLVGFAGVGEQRVFTGEVSLAARLLGERYGAEHRTLLLLNDQRDLESKPLATVSGLERALTGVGRRMRRDRDVLFLFLSSHGSTESLSVSNGGLPLQQLSGKDLAAALKASGIRWKVIVISACHAGAFIAPLRDDNTIILTAAAADRTSFGCSDDRDLTYFGEAFYRDALPGAATLEAAFDQARKAIADRERAEKITPSNPQAFFGPAMAEKLKELESLRPNAGSTRIAGPI